MRVLLIEPDLLQAKTLAAAVRHEGYEAIYAFSAQSAIQAADEHDPDIIVMELQLPGHNGIEFLYEFRSYPEWLHVPVIFYTFVPAHEFDGFKDLEPLLGVKRILYKPTTSLAMLCSILGQTGASSSA